MKASNALSSISPLCQLSSSEVELGRLRLSHHVVFEGLEGAFELLQRVVVNDEVVFRRMQNALDGRRARRMLFLILVQFVVSVTRLRKASDITLYLLMATVGDTDICASTQTRTHTNTHIHTRIHTHTHSTS